MFHQLLQLFFTIWNKIIKKLERQKQLIKEIKLNNSYSSYKELLDDYSPLIKSLSWKLCQTYKDTPITREDLENVLSFGLYELTINFKEEKGKAFPAYIKQHLLYKGLNYLRLYITNSHKTLNYSLDDKMIDNGKKDSDQNDLVDFLLSPLLNDLETEVISSIIDGVSLKEIALEIGKSSQTTYLIKKRAMDKIRKNIFSDI